MFRFRLQRVLELRLEAEQAAAGVLAVARENAERARDALELLDALHERTRLQINEAQTDDPRIGHLRQLGLVLQSLEARVDSAVAVRQSADAAVEIAQATLDAAARDRRVLDRLKERHATAWRATEAHQDQLQMDEIALARFGRTNSADNGAFSSSTESTGAGQSAPTRHTGSPS